MDGAEQMPPARLGVSEPEAMDAYTNGKSVRYWPLVDRACRPYVGTVRGFREEHGRLVLWLFGKTGYVLASHCEAV